MCCQGLRPARKVVRDIFRFGHTASHGTDSANRPFQECPKPATCAGARTARRSDPAAPACRDRALSLRRALAPPSWVFRLIRSMRRLDTSSGAADRPSACHARLLSAIRFLHGSAWVISPFDLIQSKKFIFTTKNAKDTKDLNIFTINLR